MNIPGYDQAPPEMSQGGALQDAGTGEDQGAQGDGLQHHEIHEMPDGSAHSKHTDPEGNVEEMDHDSYEDACAACAGDDQGEGDEEDGGGDAEASFADDGEDDGGMNNVAQNYAKKARA